MGPLRKRSREEEPQGSCPAPPAPREIIDEEPRTWRHLAPETGMRGLFKRFLLQAGLTKKLIMTFTFHFGSPADSHAVPLAAEVGARVVTELTDRTEQGRLAMRHLHRACHCSSTDAINVVMCMVLAACPGTLQLLEILDAPFAGMRLRTCVYALLGNACYFVFLRDTHGLVCSGGCMCLLMPNAYREWPSEIVADSDLCRLAEAKISADPSPEP